MKITKQKKKSKSTLATARKVLKYLRHYRLLLALSLIFATVVVVLTLYLPVLTGRAVDLIVGKDDVDFDGIAAILQTSAVVILITAAAQWLMNVCNNRITFGVVRRLRLDAFRRIQSLPLSFLDRRPVGDTVSRVIADADQFTDGLLMGFSQFFTGVLTIAGTLSLSRSISRSKNSSIARQTPFSAFHFDKTLV